MEKWVDRWRMGTNDKDNPELPFIGPIETNMSKFSHRLDAPFSKTLGLALGLAFANIDPGLANGVATSSIELSSKDFVKIDLMGSGVIEVDLREATINAALDALADKTGISIKYSNTPDERFTLNCHGNTIKQVLLCLLGDGADLLFEYSGKGTPTHVTVLASTFKDDASRLSVPVLENNKAVATAKPAKQQAPVEKAMAMLSSKNAEDRASGLELLGRAEDVDTEILRGAYLAGLRDESGEVRAAALTGLAILDKGNSIGFLAEAMNDEDPNVRLTAVDGMQVNQESRLYLEKALSDTDESVRLLAGLRLGLIQ